MRVLYMSWGEVPRLSSVYGGQVVEVVAALQRHPEIERAGLLAGFPLIHSGMVREKWHYHRQISAIRSRLGGDGFVTRRLAVPPVGVHPQPWQLPLFTAGHERFLAKHIQNFGADIIQCRSYVATHFALKVRARYRLPVKIVFDARSLMPEEARLAGRWKDGSPAYRFWKDTEKAMLAAADLSNAVSTPMQDRFDVLGARRTALVHLNAEVRGLNEDKISDTSRLDAGAPVLAYAGYLAENSWHQPENLWLAFAGFRDHCPGARLLLITKSDHSALKSSLAAFGRADLVDAITFTSASAPAETVQLLQGADISILSYRTPKTAFERELAEPVFATKSAEYLAVGLPLLVNRYCGGVREYALARNAGAAYDPEAGPCAETVAKLLDQARDRLRISREARNDFSLTANADRLVQLYKNLEGSTEDMFQYCAGRKLA
ncbi:glycosyltransferase [Novosphingobium sp. BL-8A]|uniref:glycosyltransferase n=1 Tax=Novosphingobium sp. BL-8A TaxID=3127639 RepID=UPI003757174E